MLNNLNYHDKWISLYLMACRIAVACAIFKLLTHIFCELKTNNDDKWYFGRKGKTFPAG